MAGRADGERVKYIGQDRDKGFYPDKLLGVGSENTEVYLGFFQKKRTAVKRVHKINAEFARREIDILGEDGPPLTNVVSSYWVTPEENPRDNYYYLVLELCAATLEDFIAGKYKGPMPSDRQVLCQICKGLKSVHLRGIAHKDLRPSNILISMLDDRGQVSMKLADFGLSRKTFDKEVTNTKNKGTSGWLAPEIVSDTTRVKFISADIFSLGCVLYYFITRGRHPFGENYERQANIQRNNRTIDSKIVDHTATSVIENMTEHEPEKRPSIDQVLLHPFLWSPERTVKFLTDTSDYLESSRREGAPADLKQLAADMEKGAQNITGGDWVKELSPCAEQHVHTALKKQPDYFRKVLKLLRTIRNWERHFHELPAAVKEELGDSNKEEFCKYWTGRFPKLLMHTWNVMKNCTSTQFAEFYQKPEETSQVSSPPCSGITTTRNTQENTPQESMPTYEFQAVPQTSGSAPSSAVKETVEQQLQRLNLAKAGSTAGSPFSNSGELGGRDEGASAEVQREGDPEDKRATKSVSNDSVRVYAVRHVHFRDYKKVGNSSVKLVVCNPQFCKEAAVAFRDGSLLFCHYGRDPVTIQGPTGRTSATSAPVWNATGTWVAAGDESGRVVLWNRHERVTKTNTFPELRVVSMQWSFFEGKDVIQIVFDEKFYVMDTDSTFVGEFRFPQNCSLCLDWNGNDKFAVAIAGAIHLYKVDLSNEHPLILQATLHTLGSKDKVRSIRWNPFDSNWIAACYEQHYIQIWNLTDSSTPQCDKLCPPLSWHRPKLEWMDSGLGNPMLAMCDYNRVEIYHPRNNWECVKRISLLSGVSKLKYLSREKSLFVSSWNELTMINAWLKEEIVHESLSIISDFDLSCDAQVNIPPSLRKEGGKFFAVIGDIAGCVTYKTITTRSLPF